MIDAFITYIEAEKRYSPLTVRNYRHDLEAFAEWWCRRHGEETLGFDVTRLCEEDMREWIMQRICDGGISAASMNRELSTLRSFMRFMRKKGVVDHDLFKRIAALKTPKRLPDFVPETATACELPGKCILPQPAQWAALYVGKGKRDKISRGDLAGFFIKKGGLRADEVGPIMVFDNYSYVAVKMKRMREVLKSVAGEKIKGIKTIIEPVRG